MHTKGVSTFKLAEVSNMDVEGVRAMYLEKRFTPIATWTHGRRSRTSHQSTPQKSCAQSRGAGWQPLMGCYVGAASQFVRDDGI